MGEGRGERGSYLLYVSASERWPRLLSLATEPSNAVKAFWTYIQVAEAPQSIPRRIGPNGPSD